MECLEARLLLTAPVADDVQYETVHDEALIEMYLSGSTTGIDPLTYAIATSPGNGTLSSFDPATGTFDYTPNASFAGQDSFLYTVSAGGLTSAPALVTIDVTNTAPEAGEMYETATVVHDRVLTDWLSGWDDDYVDQDSLIFNISTAPANGSVSIDPNSGEYTYTPNTSYVGSDSFAFTASDGIAISDPAVVLIEVTNQAPTAYSEDEFYIADTQTSVVIDIVGNDTDPDGDSLTGVIVSSPSHGTLAQNTDGTFTYTPTNTGHYGLDSFSYVANDGVANSNTIVAQVRRFGLRIKKGNTDVTGAATSALMGEKVSFTMDIKGGLELFRSDEKWSVVSPDAFKSWSVVNSLPKLQKFNPFATPLDPDLVGESVDIHYSAPGVTSNRPVFVIQLLLWGHSGVWIARDRIVNGVIHASHCGNRGPTKDPVRFFRGCRVHVDDSPGLANELSHRSDCFVLILDPRDSSWIDTVLDALKQRSVV